MHLNLTRTKYMFMWARFTGVFSIEATSFERDLNYIVLGKARSRKIFEETQPLWKCT